MDKQKAEAVSAPKDTGSKSEGIEIDVEEVRQIVRNVREGIRTKAELQRCGCVNCKEALKVLKGVSR